MNCCKCGTYMIQSNGDQYGTQHDCPKCGHSEYTNMNTTTDEEIARGYE